MTFRSVILILIAVCLPTLVYAECTLTLECGGGYGTRTMNFPDKSSCEAKLRETQNWLQSVGGGCDITDACTCEQYSEPTYTPPPYDYEAERLRDEEQESRLEEQRKKEEEEARQRLEEFERNKAEAIKSLKGVTGSEFGLKGADEKGELGLKGNEDDSFKLKGDKDSNPCPGALTCFTYFCGGTSGHPYVCVPKGFPYLNHCNCKPYNSSDFECKSYSKCEPR